MASILEPLIQFLNDSLKASYRLLRRFINYGNIIGAAPTLNTECSTIILNEVNSKDRRQDLSPLLVYSSLDQWHLIFINSKNRYVCQETLPDGIIMKEERLDKDLIYKIEGVEYM